MADNIGRPSVYTPEIAERICMEMALTFFWSRGVKGLGSPQCNASENIAVRLGKPVWAVLKFFPVVFVPISLVDYQ